MHHSDRVCLCVSANVYLGAHLDIYVRKLRMAGTTRVGPFEMWLKCKDIESKGKQLLNRKLREPSPLLVPSLIFFQVTLK